MENLEEVKYKSKLNKINGYELFSRYYVNGSPTVLFEAGMGDSSEIWASIQNKISLFTTTFSYDRARIGKSGTSAIPRTCLDIVEDLFELL